jgi:hypothetical protein
MLRRLVSCLLLLAPASAWAQTVDGEIMEVLPPREGDPEAPPDGTETDSEDEDGASYELDTGSRSGGGNFHLGLRTGWGIPLGESRDNFDFSDGIAGQIPIWVDAGYGLTDKLVLGIYFQFGIVIVEEADAPGSAGCPEGSDCSANDIRLGAELFYNFAPNAATRPWLGVGAGYEFFNGSVDDASTSLRGFEYLNLQFGLDFPISESGTIGPFVAFTLGRFDTASSDSALRSGSESIPNPANHEWLFLGIRGVSVL